MPAFNPSLKSAVSKQTLQIDSGQFLLSLQHADSFFPSGAIALSGGLETLVNEERVTSSAQVERFVHGQLQFRWAPFDRQILVAAWRAMGDLPRVGEVDALVEAQTLAAESRAGSKRAGQALLGVHARLGTPRAAEYQRMIADKMAHGHNTVAQGVVWHAIGIGESEVELMSAYAFCAGTASAALRLGVIGHLDCQAIIAGARPLIRRILLHEATGLDGAYSFTPEQEIAVMRHEAHGYRLFAN